MAHLDVGHGGRSLGKKRARAGEQSRLFDLIVGRHGPDRNHSIRAAVRRNLADPGETGHARQVNERRRGGEPKLHERDQTLPARQHLRSIPTRREERERLIERGRPVEIEGAGDHERAPDTEPPCERASWIRRHTASFVSGSSWTRTPNGRSASSTAPAMAAGAGIDAPSPAAFCPSVVKGDGTE